MLPAVSALAEDKPLEPWRMISGDRRLITSECLGSNATPDCLADTVLACELFSPGPDYSLDGLYHEDPLCSSPGVRLLLSSTPLHIDPQLATIYYSFDRWVLTADDLWSWGEGWKVGDLAVDVETFGCFPRAECTQNLPAGLPAEEILAQCPPVECTFSDVVDFQTGRRRPGITYIMRQASDGWHIVDMYKNLNVGRDAQKWDPPHWYRK